MIASSDQVAADAYGAVLLGKDLTELTYITKAQAAGVGTADYHSLKPVIISATFDATKNLYKIPMPVWVNIPTVKASFKASINVCKYLIGNLKKHLMFESIKTQKDILYRKHVLSFNLLIFYTL